MRGLFAGRNVDRSRGFGAAAGWSNFDVIRQEVGEVDSGGKVFGEAKVSINDEAAVVSAWREIDVGGEGIFVLAWTTERVSFFSQDDIEILCLSGSYDSIVDTNRIDLTFYVGGPFYPSRQKCQSNRPYRLPPSTLSGLTQPVGRCCPGRNKRRRRFPRRRPWWC